MEWQPIETAPKDGTRILVVTNQDKMTVIRYDATLDDWMLYSDGINNISVREVNLTHWMPLPPPPTE